MQTKTGMISQPIWASNAVFLKRTDCDCNVSLLIDFWGHTEQTQSDMTYNILFSNYGNDVSFGKSRSE
jgi:hypothetical protein